MDPETMPLKEVIQLMGAAKAALMKALQESGTQPSPSIQQAMLAFNLNYDTAHLWAHQIQFLIINQDAEVADAVDKAEAEGNIKEFPGGSKG